MIHARPRTERLSWSFNRDLARARRRRERRRRGRLQDFFRACVAGLYRL